MPIWIKYKGSLMLCDCIIISESAMPGKHAIYAYPSSGGVDGPCITVKEATEQKAKDFMREVAAAVANGQQYLEIPDITPKD